MTNFDFLLSTPAFASFSDVAISAEKTKRALKTRNTKKSIDAKIFWVIMKCGTIYCYWLFTTIE